MWEVIRNFFIVVLLGFFTVASAQLPPEIRADAYLLQAEQAIRNGDIFRAQAAIQNILRLQKEHELDLSDEFHFRYAKAADAVDLSDQALEAVLKYLVASGREGQHYVEALALMNKVRDRSSEDVVASQLSPNIITDAHLLQAEQSIRDGDDNRARDAMQNIRNLQEQHELDLPDEFHFRYAKAGDVLDLSDQALESVVKYLAVSGREGQHYLEALALMNKVQIAVSCEGWDTEEYFKTATLEDVAACLDTGVDLNARDDAGATPLHCAARNTESADVVKALIDAGADPNARDEYGEMPLHDAARNSENPDVIKVLIDAGADPMARSKEGWTPLHCAAASNENPNIIVVLVDGGADINARLNEHGNTPLVLAELNNKNKAVVRILRDGGARKSQEEGGFLKTAAALLGGAAIMYAGKDAEDQEAVARAVREYMKGVINEQPAGTINPAATSSQSQRGQGQGQLQQALLNLEKVCGEKYQGNFSVNDHARFFCLAAFNDYCALKRAKSDEAISKLWASLQQNCAALKKDGLDSKCPYCK